jgi:hypothetical protein
MTLRRSAALLLAATGIAAVTRPSLAQSAGDGFLFKKPVATWAFHGGYDRALAGGDLFAFVTKQLTLSRSDFGSVTFGSTLAIHGGTRTDLVFDVRYSGVSRNSEFRDWVDQNNLPIQQTTSLRRVPITIGLRHYLTAPGRAIGQFAWIPAARTTYVGAGVGFMEYKFHQVGDFVDFQTLNVFHDEFQSQAWTPTLHVLAGLEVTLGQFFVLTGEARYTWARGPIGQDYVGFHRIDLSGLSLTTGFAFRLQ